MKSVKIICRMSIYLIFGISLLALIFSSNLLLKFVEKFSSKIKISPLIIGSTIIAVGTSLPETSVGISSIVQGVPNISFGDIIGSNIANICLVLGLGIVLFPIRIGTKKTQKNNVIMLLLTLSFAALFFIPESLRRSLGILLIVFYGLFLIIETIWGEIGSLKEDKKALSKMQKNRGSALTYLLGTMGSLGGLIISSRYLVASAISISQNVGVREEVIGLSMVAVGTSLPELATTIASGIKRDWKLLYGDIQGSNIYNLSIIGAMLIIFGKRGYFVDPFSLIFMTAATILIIILSHKYEGTHIPRVYGILFITAYLFYLLKIFKTF